MKYQNIKSADSIKISVVEFSDYPQLESEWVRLQNQVKPSYFLTWGWIGSWLRVLPDTITPKVMVAELEGDVVALAILTENSRPAKGIFKFSRFFILNETGDPEYDLLRIEYNDILVSKECQPYVVEACLEYLKNNYTGWDEVVVNAVDTRSQLVNMEIIGSCGLNLKTMEKQPSWYVDYLGLRSQGKSYIDHLSRNTRYQIRRALKECGKSGDLELSVASSTEEAAEYLNRLSIWHNQHWETRGLEGCFTNPFFMEFHQELIKERFDKGEVQLVKLTLNRNELAYLYNLVIDKCVYFYQCGINYENGKKLKPGLVAHYKTIGFNMEQGMSVYNFLASDDRYKRSLSTSKDELLWVSFQKPMLKFIVEKLVEDCIEGCKKAARKVRSLYRANK